MVTYCARQFSELEIEAIRALIAQNPGMSRNELSRRICEFTHWISPNGKLKEMMCRVAMLRMQKDGLITLPAPRHAGVRARRHYPATAATEPQAPVVEPVHELAALRIEPVWAKQSRLWNEYIARYHYLGYSMMCGAQMRLNIFAGEQLVALISFGPSAWKLAARESFIGWSETQRQRNLQLVVGNARFLILPWIESKGLASKILALCARKLPALWLERYGYSPVMFETFVETARHRGTCYKAANWTMVGQTSGRGKRCPVTKAILPIKDIWLYPLCKDWRARLCD